MGVMAVHGYGAVAKVDLHNAGIGFGAFGVRFVCFTKLGNV